MWSLYLIASDGDWYLVERNYWEIRIDERHARETLADRQRGVNNTYVKVLEDNNGEIIAEKELP